MVKLRFRVGRRGNSSQGSGATPTVTSVLQAPAPGPGCDVPPRVWAERGGMTDDERIQRRGARKD